MSTSLSEDEDDDEELDELLLVLKESEFELLERDPELLESYESLLELELDEEEEELLLLLLLRL